MTADCQNDGKTRVTVEPVAGEITACSFCGKQHDEVNTLIVAPSVSICDECVRLCYDIVAEKAHKRNGQE